MSILLWFNCFSNYSTNDLWFFTSVLLYNQVNLLFCPFVSAMHHFICATCRAQLGKGKIENLPTFGSILIILVEYHHSSIKFPFILDFFMKLELNNQKSKLWQFSSDFDLIFGFQIVLVLIWVLGFSVSYRFFYGFSCGFG